MTLPIYENGSAQMQATWENGYCLPLDDLCYQTLTLSLLCRYYRAAVLPDDPALEAEIRKTGQRCQICGAWYSPKGRNAKYCPAL